MPTIGPPVRSPTLILATVRVFLSIVCIVAGGILILTSPARANQGVQRFGMPGSYAVLLDPSATWTIYYEYRSKSLNTQTWPPNMEIRVEDAANGQPLATRRTQLVEYRNARYAGFSLATFEVDRPMTVTVTSSLLPNEPKSVYVLVLSPQPIQNPYRDVLPGLLIIGLGLLVAVRVTLPHVPRRNSQHRSTPRL